MFKLNKELQVKQEIFKKDELIKNILAANKLPLN